MPGLNAGVLLVPFIASVAIASVAGAMASWASAAPVKPRHATRARVEIKVFMFSLP